MFFPVFAVFVAAHISFHYGTPYFRSLLSSPNHSLCLSVAVEESSNSVGICMA